MVEPSHPVGRIENPNVRHERTDVYVLGILWSAVGFVVLALVIQLIVDAVYRGLKDYEARVKESTFPLAAQQRQEQGKPLPPPPRLEPIDRVERVSDSDIEYRLATKNAILHEYGLTPEAGYIHIPIEQAMKQLENKLPTRTTSEGSGKE
jgi:hypothetical protein